MKMIKLCMFEEVMLVITTLSNHDNTFVFVAHTDGVVEARPVFDAPNCTPWHRMYDGKRDVCHHRLRSILISSV
jgi:hypothetical protein